MMKEIIRQELYRTPMSKLGGLLARGAFERMGARLDYTEYGGALLLGVNGVVIIGHGRSNAKAVRNAVRVAVQAVRTGMLDAIHSGLEQSAALVPPEVSSGGGDAR
jgi:glycerol-3-phosphate acyltransferase PlsX